ncbi:hypothetical protein FRX31_019914 [Thalictrum thalictroides]|uniref:Uncharacterized protein n=1 Tax=Thalictrum thalictroides TaxID=46969 RepID=A0A7J6VZE8_THATH|nr:hypothetical protein FRX31_019914 [Thalictrum thalictroides]
MNNGLKTCFYERSGQLQLGCHYSKLAVHDVIPELVLRLQQRESYSIEEQCDTDSNYGKYVQRIKIAGYDYGEVRVNDKIQNITLYISTFTLQHLVDRKWLCASFIARIQFNCICVAFANDPEGYVFHVGNGKLCLIGRRSEHSVIVIKFHVVRYYDAEGRIFLHAKVESSLVYDAEGNLENCFV